jgi:hypothetical protein
MLCNLNIKYLQVAGQLAVDGQDHQLWHVLAAAAHVVQPLTQAEAGRLNLLLACNVLDYRLHNILQNEWRLKQLQILCDVTQQ